MSYTISQSILKNLTWYISWKIWLRSSMSSIAEARSLVSIRNIILSCYDFIESPAKKSTIMEKSFPWSAQNANKSQKISMSMGAEKNWKKRKMRKLRASISCRIDIVIWAKGIIEKLRVLPFQWCLYIFQSVFFAMLYANLKMRKVSWEPEVQTLNLFPIFH